ncbi:MAG: Nif11-like leader peptide family natural product precursor, partial [Vicinamibacterales bacterium]
MSLDNAKKLLALASGNDTLRQQIQAAGRGGFAELARANGLSCTYDEFIEASRLGVGTKLSDKITHNYPIVVNNNAIVV